MKAIVPSILNLVVAVGVGLLVGVDRERTKGDGPTRRAAGLRTFALVALAGAVARLPGDAFVLGIVVLGVAAFAVVAYLRRQRDDPGITTAVALVLTALLGALAMDRPDLSAGLGVVVAILLAAKSPLHRFVRETLSPEEVSDGLIFAALMFVVWPLLPDRPLAGLEPLNPHKIWLVVILITTITALGHATSRILGVRFGLPLTGLVSGFISSSMTIGAMSSRAATRPDLMAPAVAGAVLSTVATIVQAGLILLVLNRSVALAMMPSLAFAGVAAVIYSAVFMTIAMKARGGEPPKAGRAFSLSKALTFAAVFSVAVLASARLIDAFGDRGLLVGAALAGLADVHAGVVSVVGLVDSGRLPAPGAVTPILLALSTNTMTKLLFALSGGAPGFLWRVGPGLVIVAAAAWLGAALRLA